jgi:hypothetical protein
LGNPSSGRYFKAINSRIVNNIKIHQWQFYKYSDELAKLQQFILPFFDAKNKGVTEK